MVGETLSRTLPTDPDRRRDHPPPAPRRGRRRDLRGLPGPRDPALDRRAVALHREHAVHVHRARREARPTRPRTLPRLRRRRSCVGSFSLMEIDRDAPLRRDRLLGRGAGARARRGDARGDAAARLGGARSSGSTLIELLDPRGQRCRRSGSRSGPASSTPASAARRRGRGARARRTTTSTPGAPSRARACARRSRPSCTGRRRRRATRRPSAASRAGSPSSAVSAAASASASPGGTSSAAPVAAISGKPPTARQQQRLAERERREQHAGLVDLAVGQHDEVGGAERARELGAGHEAQRGAHAGPCDEAPRPSAACRRSTARRRPAVRAPPGLEQHVDALVGPEQAEEQHHGLASGSRERRLASARRAPSSAPCGITWTCRVEPELVAQPRRRRARSARRSRPSARRAPAGRRAGPAAARAAARRARSGPAGACRQQEAVQRLHRQPLEVHDVGGPRRPPVPQHVRHVLREPRRPARRRAGRTPRAPSRRAPAARRRGGTRSSTAPPRRPHGRAPRPAPGRRAACRPPDRPGGRAPRPI